MLYNSLQFLLFYIIITISYWYLPHKYRWLLLLLSSCYFYMAFVPMYILILGFAIAKNGKQLYYGKTIDTVGNTSSFKYLSKNDIDIVINSLNYLYKQGKKGKFDEIYLSIIPNPVLILDSIFNHLRYNNLVRAIQSSPKLQMPYIDIMSDFENQKNGVVRKADTHWNFHGANLWLGKLNAELKRVSMNKNMPPVTTKL